MSGRIHSLKRTAPAAPARRTLQPVPAVGAPAQQETDFEGLLDRAERFGHRLDALGIGPARPAAGSPAGGAPVQRKVLPVRGGKKNEPTRYRSTLTGQTYDTREAAEAAERVINEQRETREKEVKEQLDSIDFSSFGSNSNSTGGGFNPLSGYMGRHPAHFGPLMTQGGQVKTSEVGKAVGEKVLAPGKNPNEDSTFHSGQNTYASIFSNLELFGESLGINAVSKSGEVMDEEELPEVENAGREFRDEHIFMQGTPGEDEHVHLPDGRKDAHAEAQAVHSEAMDTGIEDTGSRLNALLQSVHGATSISAEPTDQEIENFSQTLGLAPFLSASTEIALNRSSCNSGSGYKGGCNQEMADFVPKFYQKHEKNVGKESANMHRALGLIGPRLSVAGPYEGGKANLAIPLKGGMRMRPHNKYDWKNRKLKGIDRNQKKLVAQIRAAQKKREAEIESAEKQAPSWGGQGPGSLKPFDNWGTNHPLHFRWNPDRDDGGSAV
jgi:hypothetical protein